MSRRPARFTEAEVRRLIRAAKHEGAKVVEIFPFRIVLDGTDKPLPEQPNPWDAPRA